MDAGQSSEIEMYRRIHSDLFNVPQLFWPGAKLQIKFTKATSNFYVLSSKSDARTVLKFSDATLYVKHVKRMPNIQSWRRRTQIRSDQLGAQHIHVRCLIEIYID